MLTHESAAEWLDVWQMRLLILVVFTHHEQKFEDAMAELVDMYDAWWFR